MVSRRAALAAALALPASALSAQPIETTPTPDDALSLYTWLYAIRAEQTLSPLRMDAQLLRGGELKAHNLMSVFHSEYRHLFLDDPDFQHRLGSGGLFWPAMLSRHFGYSAPTHEAIASAYPSVAAAFKALVDSPPHRAGLLDPAATECGFGVSYDRARTCFLCVYVGGAGLAPGTGTAAARVGAL